MPTVEFLPFATSVSANVDSQGSYAGSGRQNNGFSAGEAFSAQFNKVWRQSSVPAAAIANYMANVLNEDVLDDGNLLVFWAQFWRALLRGGYFVDTGSVNSLLVAAPFGLTFPAPAAGLRVSVKIANTNTDVCTFNWMGNGSVSIVYPDASVVKSGDLPAGGIVELEFDGTNWQLITLTPTALKNRLGRLFQNINYYVSTTGNDSNDGLNNGTPFRNIQHAVDTIQASYSDLANFTITVNITPGTYNESINANYQLNGTIKFTVNGSGIVTISSANNDCFKAVNGAHIFIDGGTSGSFVFSATSIVPGAIASGCAILCDILSTVQLGQGISYAACTNYHIVNLGFTTIQNNYNISGAAAGHILCSDGRLLVGVNGVNVNLTGTPAFTTFITVTNPCTASMAGMTFSGSGATGQRYSVTFNGVLTTGSGSETFFPGSSAGAYSRGGQYA